MASTTGFPTAAVAENAPLPSALSSKNAEVGSLQTDKENCENRKEDVEYESFQKLVESWSQHPENFEEDVMVHGPKTEEEEEEEPLTQTQQSAGEEQLDVLANAAAENFGDLRAVTTNHLHTLATDFHVLARRLIKAADRLKRDRQAHLRPQTSSSSSSASLCKWFKAQVKYKKDSKKVHRVLDVASVLHVSAAFRLLDGDDVVDDDVEECMPEDFRNKIETFLEQGGILKRPASSIDYESRWGT